MNGIKGLEAQQNSKDQSKAASQQLQQQQLYQKLGNYENSMKIEDENRVDQQKQQQLLVMKNQLLSKFRNILDNIYSSNIQHNEQIEKELNELSQILEMPMDSLIVAMKNVQNQYSPSQEKQNVPPFFKELDALNRQDQNKNEKERGIQQDNAYQDNQNSQQTGKNLSLQQKQQVTNGPGNFQNSLSLNSFKEGQANGSNSNGFGQQQFLPQQLNLATNQTPKSGINSTATSSKQKSAQHNRFLSENSDLLNNNEQFFSNNTPSNAVTNPVLNNSSTQDLIQKSNEFFSFATQSRKTNFFLQDFNSPSNNDGLQMQQQQQQQLQSLQQQAIYSQQSSDSNKTNRNQPEKNAQLQQILNSNNRQQQYQDQMTSPTSNSSYSQIKQMQLSPFTSIRQNNQQQSTSYSSQYQMKKDQLSKRQNSNSARDEDIIKELNRIQQTQQQREDSSESRSKNKQLRLLQMLSRTSPERQQQYLQEKMKYQMEEMYDKGQQRSNSKDSDSTENSSLPKRIINLQPTKNLSLSPEQLESFQESPINIKTQRGYQGVSEDLIKSINSQRSPLNVSKNNFIFPQTSKSINNDKPQLQQYFSSQQKTLQLIETHQELDDLRKKIDDLNIDICNKDIEIIDLSTKLREQKNQQLTITYKIQQENKQFDQVRVSLSDTKNYLNSQIKQYLEVLQDIQASVNSSHSLKAKAAKKVRNSAQLSERSLQQSGLKNSVRLSKTDVPNFDSYSKPNNKEEANQSSTNKPKLGGMPSSSNFSDGKANNNKSILEDEEEDQLSEDQSIDINRNSLEQDEILSTQPLEETDSYFVQYIQTQKLLNSQLQSLQANEPHKLKVQSLQSDLSNIKQENLRLQEQISQMSGILKGINNMQEQEEELELYMQKLEQEKKGLELTLDELNRIILRKKNELSKAREKLNSKLSKVKTKKEEVALEHNQIISRNQIQIQELQKKKNQVNSKVESELNVLRKELRSKTSLNNFERANLENDIKKKQEILDLFSQKQYNTIKPQLEKLQQELTILQQTNKLLKKDIDGKKEQLEILQNEEDDSDYDDDDDDENPPVNQSQYAIELRKIKKKQKQLKFELQQEKEKLQLEKSFSNNKNEEFILYAEQKLNYHAGLKTQLEKLNQEIEQLEAKKEQCVKVQQGIELTINNSKEDISSHEQLATQIKQMKESNQILINKINQMATIIKEKKNIALKQDDEIENKLRPQLGQTISLITDLSMEEQELIHKRKQLKDQLQ